MDMKKLKNDYRREKGPLWSEAAPELQERTGGGCWFECCVGKVLPSKAKKKKRAASENQNVRRQGNRGDKFWSRALEVKKKASRARRKTHVVVKGGMRSEILGWRIRGGISRAIAHRAPGL